MPLKAIAVSVVAAVDRCKKCGGMSLALDAAPWILVTTSAREAQRSALSLSVTLSRDLVLKNSP
jgi:hypothetical protein